VGVASAAGYSRAPPEACAADAGYEAVEIWIAQARVRRWPASY